MDGALHEILKRYHLIQKIAGFSTHQGSSREPKTLGTYLLKFCFNNFPSSLLFLIPCSNLNSVVF